MLQLYQITNLNHGLMLVGASGSGKTTAWRVLLKALERLEGVEGVAYVIDAKVCYKIWFFRRLLIKFRFIVDFATILSIYLNFSTHINI